jgi:nucleotide-binding universal stress UspA family protein
MHDVRFRQMESGLPEEFRDEDEMKRQRKIHDQLITKGLEIITDSYIDVLEPLCEKYDVELVRRSLEGKNFKVIVEDVNDNDFDLVVIGAMGMAAVKDTVLGTVTERVVRRLTRPTPLSSRTSTARPFEHIVVAVDGSAKSLGGLKRAIELAREFGGTVEAISVFDPYFHYAMFHSIAGVLSSKAQKVFRFKEQEKLHEEIIDSGLAKIYTAHLEVAKKIAEDEGVDLKTTLLAGKPFEQTLKYVNEVNPTLVVMGRIGYHSDDEMDIGGNTENMMRYLPTNVLVGNYEYQAPDLYTAEEHMTWTDEALQRLDRIPGFVVGMATGAIIRYAIEKGYTVITTGVIDEVIKSILPPGAMESMRAIGDQMREAEAMGEEKPIDSLFKDFDERTADAAKSNGTNGSVSGNGHRRTGTATVTSRRRKSSRPVRAASVSPRTRATSKACRRTCKMRSGAPRRGVTATSATYAATWRKACPRNVPSAARTRPISTRSTQRSRRPTSPRAI